MSSITFGHEGTDEGDGADTGEGLSGVGISKESVLSNLTPMKWKQTSHVTLRLGQYTTPWPRQRLGSLSGQLHRLCLTVKRSTRLQTVQSWVKESLRRRLHSLNSFFLGCVSKLTHSKRGLREEARQKVCWVKKKPSDVECWEKQSSWSWAALHWGNYSSTSEYSTGSLREFLAITISSDCASPGQAVKW